MTHVLVSGGTGGIGSAICRTLHHRGYGVVLTFHRRADLAARLAAELSGVAVTLDLENPAGVEDAMADLARDGVDVSAVVLAASPPPEIAAFGRITDAEMERQWRVNVRGSHRLLAAVLKTWMRRKQRGTAIAVLTSAMGETGHPAAGGMAGYVEAKFGLKGVLTAAQAEFGWLRVGFIAPGFVETPMLKAFDDRWLAAMREQRPEGRFLAPEEVATQVADMIGRLDELGD